MHGFQLHCTNPERFTGVTAGVSCLAEDLQVQRGQGRAGMGCEYPRGQPLAAVMRAGPGAGVMARLGSSADTQSGSSAAMSRLVKL